MQKVFLTQNKFALVDDEDYLEVLEKRWAYHHSGYAVNGHPQISMHRFIMNFPKGNIDHKNGDKLDNRKSNLRIATPSQNIHNSLRDDGVHWREDRKAWIVRMKVDGRSHYVGYFKSRKEALKARRKASIAFYGDYSPYARTP